jgi:prevent-host-death family protein
MKMKIVSSREFNQDTSRIKKAASQGPVFITERGRPAHVLLSIEEYRKLLKDGSSLAERLGGPHPASEIEFEPDRIEGVGFRVPDFS